MLGWKIFVHSVRMILRNVPAILRIFWAPIALCIAFFAGFLFLTGLNEVLVWGETVDIPADRLPRFYFLWIVIIWIATGIMSAWGITAWHRFILLEEIVGTIPQFDARRAFGYFFRMILLGVITLLILLPIGFVLMAIMQAVWPIAMLLLIGAVLFWGVLMLRWALILPAWALDKPLTLSESWRTWDGLENPGRKALGLILVYGVFQFVIGFVVEAFSFSPVLYTVMAILGQLFVAILNVSILTTLYGHIVEKRELA